MRVLFVRHGKSTANEGGIVGTPDATLTNEGLEQAKKIGQDLKNEHVTAIICSPFIRARQTAERIAGELNIPLDEIVVVKELGERRMGDLEGKLKQHETEFFYNNDASLGFEPHKQLIGRMQKALAKVNAIAEKTEGTTVVVGHATSGFFLLQVAKGRKTYDQFDPFSQLNNAEFTEL